jgi:glycosyltransferase involved in cell wall biosynthesis
MMGDSLSRHIYYAKKLRNKYPKSKIKIIAYTKKSRSIQYRKLHYPGLEIIGTNSTFRFTFLFGILINLFHSLKKGWHPDLITVQTPWEEGIIGWLLARVYGAAFLPQLHFDLFSYQWLKESYFNHYRKFIAKFILSQGTRVRVVSKGQQEKLSNLFKININLIDIVPVGVNFTPVRMDKMSARKIVWPKYIDKKIILFVGRLTESKNLKLWLEVAKKASTNDCSLIFMIVGDGEQLSYLKCLVNEFNLSDKVIFNGPIEHHKLPIFYRASDLFLLTSSHEGFGRVVLESQMSLLPVISTKCGGPEDLIVDGKSGLLVKVDDITEICNSIKKLLKDKHFYKNMSNFALKSSRDFSLDSLASRLIDCWEASVYETSKKRKISLFNQ